VLRGSLGSRALTFSTSSPMHRRLFPTHPRQGQTSNAPTSPQNHDAVLVSAAPLAQSFGIKACGTRRRLTLRTDRQRREGRRDGKEGSIGGEHGSLRAHASDRRAAVCHWSVAEEEKEEEEV
jgi:hypothetical protein